jgi:hypothetical protein
VLQHPTLRLVGFLLFLAVAGTSAGELSGLPKHAKTQNAAVKYLRADAALRQSYDLPKNAAVKLEKALISPLDSEDEEIVSSASEALNEFRHGAEITECNWGISTEDGPIASTAHRSAVRELVAVAGLRARLRFRNGDTGPATDDVLAGIAAARHLSMDGSIASVLISYNLEKAISHVLLLNLYRLSRSDLEHLTLHLRSLPTGTHMREAIEAEKIERNDLRTITRGARTSRELTDKLSRHVPILAGNTALAKEVVDGCGNSVRGFAYCLAQQRWLYRTLISEFVLPPEQFDMHYKAEVGKLTNTNSLIHYFTPNISKLRWEEAYALTRRALLETAVRVARNGPSALGHRPDPYDGKQFSYTTVDGGFRLSSRLKEGEQALSISVLRVPDDTL